MQCKCLTKFALWVVAIINLGLLFYGSALAAGYQLNPGDTLHISVWSEEAMKREVIVLPDGTISYPLAGQLKASGLTPKQLEVKLAKRLERFYPSPTITVAVTSTTGNVIYVLGEVRAAGQYTVSREVDVIQAIALAKGLTEFADANSIKVIRRASGGEQQAIGFNYSAVQRGRDLTSNIVLKAGDTVVVPAKGLF